MFVLFATVNSPFARGKERERGPLLVVGENPFNC